MFASDTIHSFSDSDLEHLFKSISSIEQKRHHIDENDDHEDNVQSALLDWIINVDRELLQDTRSS